MKEPREIYVDHRAKHHVHTFGGVHIPYRGMVISIAGDGEDVIVMSGDRTRDYLVLPLVSNDDLVRAIVRAKLYIDKFQCS